MQRQNWDICPKNEVSRGPGVEAQILSDQGARIPEQPSRCVMIADCGYHARFADLAASRSRQNSF